jgi:diguanylate cyclase (GGDEF)-like protein
MKTVLRWDLAIILLLFGFFAYHLHLDNVDKARTYHQERVQQMQLQYDTIIKAQTNLVDLLFNTWIDKEEVLSLMARAKRGDAGKQEAVRNALYQKLLPLYREIRRHGISYLHFHTVDNRSFLRLGTPDRYGDDLSVFRRSVVRANREHVTVRGFEEGRTFNGFRNVYPLRYRGEHIGSVEMSFSFDNVRDYLSYVFPAAYDFIIRKSLLERTLLPAERSRYKACGVCSDYLFDTAVTAANTREELTAETKQRIKEQIAGRLQTHTRSGMSFSLSPKLDDRYYALTYLSVTNLLGDHVAYIVSLREDPMMQELQLSFKKSLLLVGFFALFFVGIAYLVYLKKRQRDAFWRANLDYLTHSYSRQSCHKRIMQMVQSHHAQHKACSMLLLDIDRFSHLNSTYGQSAGDQALVTLVDLLKRTVRGSDIICRWSGDSFVVIVDTDLRTAERVAEKIRKKVETHRFDAMGQLSVSIGITELEPGDDTEEGCFKRADMALYRAKEKGGNCCVTYL